MKRSNADRRIDPFEKILEQLAIKKYHSVARDEVSSFRNPVVAKFFK